MEDTHLEVLNSLEDLFHLATQSEPVSKQAIFGKKKDIGSLHKLRLHLGVGRWSEKC